MCESCSESVGDPPESFPYMDGNALIGHVDTLTRLLECVAAKVSGTGGDGEHGMQTSSIIGFFSYCSIPFITTHDNRV